MLVTLKEILSQSIENKYAVGAFDSVDPILTESIIAAAEEKGVPVILMFVESNFDIPSADRFFRDALSRCREASVPVCLHLDHGSSFEAVMKAIHYGCSSVMIDGSALPFEENVSLTKRVVEVSHACGVSVEAEIGHVAGGEGNTNDGNVADESAYTKIEDAVKFYEETGVDALAVAVGTVHGVYKGVPKLDFERLKRLREVIPVPLVMHGGSGLSADDFRESIRCGINKINFYTGMGIAGADAVHEYLNSVQHGDISALISIGAAACGEVVKEHLNIFGTQPLN